MKQQLKIRVRKEPKNEGLVTCRSVSVREKLCRFLFGSPQKLTVIVPGDTVERISISNEEEETEE